MPADTQRDKQMWTQPVGVFFGGGGRKVCVVCCEACQEVSEQMDVADTQRDPMCVVCVCAAVRRLLRLLLRHLVLLMWR